MDVGTEEKEGQYNRKQRKRRNVVIVIKIGSILALKTLTGTNIKAIFKEYG